MSAGEGLTITTEAGAWVVPPCPAWCELPADHHLGLYVGELVEDGPSIDRCHEAGLVSVETLEGHGTVQIIQAEEVACSDPTVDQVQLVVNRVESLDVGQARQLARVLDAAADRLEVILGALGRVR